MVWSDLLVPGVPLIEKIVRPLIVYVVLLLLVRLFGKRELAQLNQYDLIVLLTISNTVQNAIIGNDTSITGGLIGALTLLGANYIVARVLYRSERLDRFIEGNATTLIENGRVLKDRLDAELITIAELEAAAHRQGFDSIEAVDRAVLSPGGTLAFSGRKPTDDVRRQQDVMAELAEIKRLLAAR
jgi:uncharacterized membrane protein YcaP (DUF421 family)